MSVVIFMYFMFVLWMEELGLQQIALYYHLLKPEVEHILTTGPDAALMDY